MMFPRYRRVMRSTVFSLATIGILAAAPSYAACTKPNPPACGATETGEFADVADFDRCRMRMLSYRDGIDVYVACVKEEGQPPENEKLAQDEFQSILSRFNRRARGE
jgi:hypothetical protein